MGRDWQARPSAVEEEAKPIEYPVRGFFVYVMAGRQRFAADILGALPPDGERIGKLADLAGAQCGLPRLRVFSPGSRP